MMTNNINFRVDGLEQAIKEAVAQAIEAQTPAKDVKENEESSPYYTRDELCHLAHISASTLWRMEKDKLIRKRKFGKTNLYLKEEIHELLESGKLDKYSR